MRRVVVLALLALALPMAAWADGIILTNQYGSISISAAGITSKGSQLKSFDNIQAPKGHSLGSVSFSTGALTSGSILGGGTFSAAGSTFVVTGKGNYGQPKGLIFSGAFLDPITWTLTSPPGQKNLTYELDGTIQGMLYNGHIVTGHTTQDIYSIQGQLVNGVGHIRMGTTGINTPEPGTLGLLGTGLVGIAGMFRRKLIVR
jgi:hypothetical protein